MNTVMVNNSITINTMNNQVSPQLIEHKKKTTTYKQCMTFVLYHSPSLPMLLQSIYIFMIEIYSS
jgi:hypothetical protein